MTAWRVTYRDKRRPWVGTCRFRILADNARRAAAAARDRLKAAGTNPIIVGVSRDY